MSVRVCLCLCVCLCVCAHPRASCLRGLTAGSFEAGLAGRCGWEGVGKEPGEGERRPRCAHRAVGVSPSGCAVWTPLEGPNGDGKAWGAGQCAAAGQLRDQEARAGQAAVSALLTAPLQAPPRPHPEKGLRCCRSGPSPGAGFDRIRWMTGSDGCKKTRLGAAPCQAPTPGAPDAALCLPPPVWAPPFRPTGSLPPPDVQQLLSLPPTPQG